VVNPLDINEPPGVAGFGAAPGVDATDTASGTHSGPVGGKLSDSGGWAARPGGGEERPADNLLGGSTIFVVVIAAGVLVVRRLNREDLSAG
jgi:hypothetical protein